MNIAIINGPNLNNLGKRDNSIYGSKSLAEIERIISDKINPLSVNLTFFQSNAEGEIIDYIQQVTEKTDAIIINPGGLTHYSISLRDCLSDFNGRIIEVHLSNIHARESFRRESLIADICEGHIAGLGWYGYLSAINYLITQ
jgi:3-dehydroquinate dehydratase-2